MEVSNISSSLETNHQDLAGTLTPYTPGSFLDSTFSLAWPSDQLRQTSPQLTAPSQLDDDVDESDDLEDVQSAVIGFLALDQTVESNGLPFVLQGCATWLSYSTYEPLSVVQSARNDILRTYVMGEQPRQILHLLTNTVNELTRSAEYDPAESTCFLALEAIFQQILAEAGAHIESTRGLNQQQANEAMLFVNQASARLTVYPIDLSPSKWIFTKCRVESLTNILAFLQLAAPIFRRACPDPLDGFINLPTLFTTTNPVLYYYIMMDVLLAMLTVRPMFFRYTVRFTPEAHESLFSGVEGRSLRCTCGIPDRLVMMFAYMNGLFEDFGSYIPKHMTDELEQDIKRMKPIVGVSTEPFLMIGRMVVQQAWFQAALIYLYMGLCGYDSTDARVVTARSRFIKLLASTKPQRTIDSFMVFPLVILGVATESQEERNMVRQRMLGVPECARPGRMGNDFVRMLENIWSKRCPVVWSDLRGACWEVIAETPVASEEDLLATLQLNLVFKDLHLTMRPRWFKKPEAITGLRSFVIITFEDPDGLVERNLLKFTVYAFGEQTAIKKWHDTPPSCWKGSSSSLIIVIPVMATDIRGDGMF
ncbi:Ferric reductase transmembrane component 4 [Rhizoctonia solani]|uniref:Ferric reductase transmembrane component 4 n=1 Tax=Rhizoctonia solani TaxID=456999 RepID=A0A0K6GCZ6_9AGAM|nr:Ferric reductase transmembrane component 4 [Rhizoctonia solani]